MDADATEDASLPGYSVPIRAPLTIDSDSEFCLSVNGQIYSRTSSFNSTSSSIDISSHDDEHTSIYEEYPDEEIVIERCSFIRPFVRYPDDNYVKESCDFSKSTIFRPFVKIPCEESSSGGGGFGVHLSVPIAPLTGDGDSDCDGDSIGDGSVDGTVMAPKVRSFNGGEGDDELQAECVFSSDDVSGVENLDSVSTESVENEGFEVECLNEVVKLYESDASSFDLQRIEALTVSSSNSEIDTKVSESDELSFDSERIDAQIVPHSDSEIENLKSVENEGCEIECLNEVLKFFESDMSSFDLESFEEQTVLSSNNEIEIETVDEKLLEPDEARSDSKRISVQVVSNSDSEIENLNFVLTESVENECLNEAVKLSELDTSSFDLERIDAQTVSSSNSEIETNVSESDELSFDSERICAQIVSNSDCEIENLNSVSTESVENEAECLNEVVKLFESDALSFDLERIDTQTVSSSNNEIERLDSQIVSDSNSKVEIKTINESEPEVVSKNEDEMQQRVRAKFLRLALNEQLTTKVNEKTGIYKFDFALTILAIGKTGVGKSATINSIFGENKATTNAFDHGTTTIQEITGNVDGIQLRVIDTPGLKRSSSDRSYNLRVLNSIKRFTRKHAPNVVLYVDRLDTLDVNDSHLLTLITSSLGSSVWHSCIIALTHAGCDPSDEPSKGFVVRRCRFLQEQIVSFGGSNRRVANPVWLVDNHPSYKHDVVDLDYGFKGLVCLDQADKVESFGLLSEPRDVINRNRYACFNEYSYRVKLFGTNHWSVGCRLWF